MLKLKIFKSFERNIHTDGKKRKKMEINYKKFENNPCFKNIY